MERKASSGSTDPSLSKQFLESDPISLSKVSKIMGCYVGIKFPPSSYKVVWLAALGHFFVWFYYWVYCEPALELPTPQLRCQSRCCIDKTKDLDGGGHLGFFPMDGPQEQVLQSQSMGLEGTWRNDSVQSHVEQITSKSKSAINQ